MMSSYESSTTDIDGYGDLKVADVPPGTNLDLAPRSVTLDGNESGASKCRLGVDALVSVPDDTRASVSHTTGSAPSYDVITSSEPSHVPVPASSLHGDPKPSDTLESSDTPVSIQIHSKLSLPNPDPTKFARNAQCTAWFPTTSPVDPTSFSFFASVRDCPVGLVDASAGRLRASCKIVDHRETFIAPHCMASSMYRTGALGVRYSG
ncbi:hypothetical protein FRC07_008395 [Ceratobasidium sp. 392]|nr:hypothetical protein FRC07_008395 [Ceratobasidium sp. 392]